LLVYHWSRRKIRNHLVDAGLVNHYQMNGLNVFTCRTREIRGFVEPRVTADPYYMVN